jgi:hypothetical protein
MSTRMSAKAHFQATLNKILQEKREFQVCMHAIFNKILALEKARKAPIIGLSVYSIMQTLWDNVPLRGIFKYCLDDKQPNDLQLAKYQQAIEMIEKLLITMTGNIDHLQSDCDEITKRDCDAGSRELKEISDAISSAKKKYAVLLNLTVADAGSRELKDLKVEDALQIMRLRLSSL